MECSLGSFSESIPFPEHQGPVFAVGQDTAQFWLLHSHIPVIEEKDLKLLTLLAGPGVGAGLLILTALGQGPICTLLD